MSHQPDPVKTGGIAPTDADTEDVTRDTYGFEQPEPDKATPEERFAEAERAAEEAGIPGIATPESPAGEAGKTAPTGTNVIESDAGEGADSPTFKRRP